MVAKTQAFGLGYKNEPVGLGNQQPGFWLKRAVFPGKRLKKAQLQNSRIRLIPLELTKLFLPGP
jgi:hypothetical protein